MAIQNWKNFLMAYEQAVDELKVKLKSIRKIGEEIMRLWIDSGMDVRR